MRLNLNEELNGPQLEAVRSIDGPVMIIAGAGSGKTRVITYRIAYMLEKGIKQSSILAMTFTNKAAKEMEIRVKELTGKKNHGNNLPSLTISTFHSFGLSVIKDNAEVLGFRKNFSVYDETDRITLIKESLKECRLWQNKTNLYELGQLFSNIKTEILEGWPEEDAKYENVYHEYQNALKLYNAVDFDDLLVLPLQVFEQQPEILEKYRSRYRYIMVDEFQDTSLIQYKLMRILAMGHDLKAKSQANVCVVGDDDQSIYSWRGANYKNFLLFEDDFKNIKEIKLEQNYRSTTTILNAANGVISHNKSRKEKKLWTGKEEGKPIQLIFPENESKEAEFIASTIRSLMTKDIRRYHDFGVLTRTNNLAANIEDAFLAENIPYKISGGTSFFQRKEIKDIISYLRLIANPRDDVSLLRIINTPARGIGKATIAAVNEIAKKKNACIWDSINYLGQQQLFQDKNAGTELECFLQLIEKWRLRIIEKRMLLSKEVMGLVDDIDYWSYLVREHSKDEKKARWKYSNIEYFARMINNWENDPDNMDRGLYAWLNRISLITKDDGENDNLGKVNLMTIHSAKGLEFPVVFIAGAEEGIIPHEKSEIEEERRLFYVAITRACEKLFISCCRVRRHLQSSHECEPSPFLEEIPKGFIEQYMPDEETDDDPLESEELLRQIKEKLMGKF